MARPDICTHCKTPLSIGRNRKNAPVAQCLNPTCPKKAVPADAPAAPEKAPVKSAAKAPVKKVRKQAPAPPIAPAPAPARKRGFFSL